MARAKSESPAKSKPKAPKKAAPKAPRVDAPADTPPEGSPPADDPPKTPRRKGCEEILVPLLHHGRPIPVGEPVPSDLSDEALDTLRRQGAIGKPE